MKHMLVAILSVFVVGMLISTIMMAEVSKNAPLLPEFTARPSYPFAPDLP